jgi:hypothetical protein
LSLDPLEERTLLSSVQAVHPLFDLSAWTARGGATTTTDLTRSPFPSDLFTQPDDSQNTGLRVNLPSPDPRTNPSDWQDTQVINTLDGFNIQPRLSIPFDGLIDVKSVNSKDVFLVSLGDTLPGGHPAGAVVGINQIVWDPLSKTLHVESDQLLDQHTRYALIVTDGVLDANEQRVQASDDFKSFRHDLNFGQTKDPSLVEYRTDLLDTMAAAAQVGAPVGHIVTASVFTTQSATAVLEKIRDQIHEATPAPAVFNLGPNGEHTVFSRDAIKSITWNQQKVVVGSPSSVNVDLSPLDVIPGALGEIAFGKYSSPDYLVHPGQYIPPVGTRDTPAVQASNEIYFNLYLPSDSPLHPKPPNGWPVAIFGHGINSGKDSSAPLNVASSMAAQGVATVVINAVGHGFGPQSTLTVSPAVGASVTFKAAGRGVDQNDDNAIDPSEGLSAAGPQSTVFYSDAYRQTAADLMQLTRVIDVGMDVDGDGHRDLDASRIYYFGQSLGGGYGTVFTAVEPSVRAAVLTVPVDPIPIGNLGLANRALLGTILGSRQPSLLDASGMGIKFLDGLEVPTPYFDENMPLRGDQTLLRVRLADGTTTRVIQSPVSNTVAGAMPIQELIEKYEWVGQAGSPAAYAPHLRKDPLPGVPAKSVIIQIAKGDETAPNPTTTAIVRAGELTDRTVYYRHDLARKAIPSLPRNPHGFMVNVPAFGAISLGAQAQIATFFASDGTEIIQPRVVPVAYFEVPIKGPLPEGLNYPGSAKAGAPAQVSGSLAAVTISTDAASDMLTATAVPAGNPLLPTVTATSRSTSAARAVPQAARAGPVPQAGPSAMPTAPLIDLAIDALPPLGWLDSTLDDLAAGLLRPAPRRH